MNNDFIIRAHLLNIMNKYDNTEVSFYDKLNSITNELYNVSVTNAWGYSRKQIEDIVRPNIAQDNFDLKVINGEGYIPWLDNEKNNIDWIHKNAYHLYLLNVKKWNPRTIRDVDKYSDIILDHMRNPKVKQFNCKGLVIGDVQSGKTANYTDLINKSIDAGYKLIIVLAGVHNDLRAQTQTRLDKEVLGYETSLLKDEAKKSIGVGKIDPRVIDVEALTRNDHNGDLKSQSGFIFLDNRTKPIIAIVKKNTTVLNKLLQIVEDTKSTKGLSQIDIPTLIIDDEVDQASVNTKKPEYDPTKINGLIRKIVNSCKRVSYVGYTATPYANILINYDPREDIDEEYGEDLFPKDFIIVLPSSPQYCGVKEFFGDSNDPNDDLIITVEDECDLVDERVTKDGLLRFTAQDEITFLTKSLKDAIDDFIVASAVRRSREGKVHNGMMIHLTAKKKPATSLKDLVEDRVEELIQKFKYDYNSSEKYQNIWEMRFKEKSIERGFHDKWEDIEKELEYVFNLLKVKLLNGDSSDVIDYSISDESAIIAVGGNKLSRGITIEGLTISYYLRTPNAYDTAMQMGRWFGYKKNYIDLCRIYTKSQMVGDFIHIFDSNLELRKDIDLMNVRDLTPATFGLKILTHPTMKPTSSCKMRSGKKMRVAFGDQRGDTTRFDINSIDCNMNLTKTFINELKESYEIEINDRTIVFRNVPSSLIIKYLNDYKYLKFNDFDMSEQWRQYIIDSNKIDELINWTVVLSSVEKKDSKSLDICGYEIKKASRKCYAKETLFTRVITAPSDFKYFFKKNDINREKYKNGYVKNDENLYSLFNPKEGLFALYPIDIVEGEEKVPVAENVMGFGIWFPKSSKGTVSDYVVNSVYLNPENIVEEAED